MNALFPYMLLTLSRCPSTTATVWLPVTIWFALSSPAQRSLKNKIFKEYPKCGISSAAEVLVLVDRHVGLPGLSICNFVFEECGPLGKKT